MTGILVFDTARRVGFAFGRPGSEPVWGSLFIGPEGGSVGEWLAPMFDLVNSKLDEFQPKYVGYLTPIHTQYDTTDRLQKLFGLTSVVDLVAQRRRDRDMPGLVTIREEDATVAKFFTGKGRWAGDSRHVRRARKKAATIDVCKRMGWNVREDDDAADALAAFYYMENKYYPAASILRGIGPLMVGKRA